MTLSPQNAWTPVLTPLVCPFCEQACEFPPDKKPSRLRRVIRRGGVEGRIYNLDPNDVEGSLKEVEAEIEAEKSYKGFLDPSNLASCGCGANILLETEEDIHEDRAQLKEWAEEDGWEIEIEAVRRVEFWGPPSPKGAEPRDPTGPYDGDYVDALFYRVSLTVESILS